MSAGTIAYLANKVLEKHIGAENYCGSSDTMLKKLLLEHILIPVQAELLPADQAPNKL